MKDKIIEPGIGYPTSQSEPWPTPRKKTWMGGIPTHCDKCGQPLAHQFIDGRTQMGQWGILCAACHHRCGVGLGTGKGQRYDLKTLEKIDG